MQTSSQWHSAFSHSSLNTTASVFVVQTCAVPVFAEADSCGGSYLSASALYSFEQFRQCSSCKSRWQWQIATPRSGTLRCGKLSHGSNFHAAQCLQEQIAVADRHFPVGARITSSALSFGCDDAIFVPGEDVDALRVSVPLPAAAAGLDQPAEATGSPPAAEGGCQAASLRHQATEASVAPACLRHPPGPMPLIPRLPRFLLHKAQACLACALSSSVCPFFSSLQAAAAPCGATPCSLFHPDCAPPAACHDRKRVLQGGGGAAGSDRRGATAPAPRPRRRGAAHERPRP